MRRRKKNCSASPSSPTSAGSSGGFGGHRPTPPPNAFTEQLFAVLGAREPEPAAMEGELPGPWQVTRHWGDGPPLWAVYGLGERSPRLTFPDEAHGDLAHLAACALAVAERPRRFEFHPDDAGRLRLTYDGEDVAFVHTPELEHTSFADDLTRLADLRVQPLALAQLLAATPATVLRRAGVIFLDELAKVG